MTWAMTEFGENVYVIMLWVVIVGEYFVLGAWRERALNAERQLRKHQNE